MSMNIMSDHLF